MQSAHKMASGALRPKMLLRTRKRVTGEAHCSAIIDLAYASSTICFIVVRSTRRKVWLIVVVSTTWSITSGSCTACSSLSALRSTSTVRESILPLGVSPRCGAGPPASDCRIESMDGRLASPPVFGDLRLGGVWSSAARA
eukprot:1203031-Prymnesium_polylepis.3